MGVLAAGLGSAGIHHVDATSRPVARCADQFAASARRHQCFPHAGSATGGLMSHSLQRRVETALEKSSQARLVLLLPRYKKAQNMYAKFGSGQIKCTARDGAILGPGLKGQY